MTAHDQIHNITKHFNTMFWVKYFGKFDSDDSLEFWTFQNQRCGCFLAGPKGAQGEAMKRSRFSEEQIAYALRLAESSSPVVDVWRQIGVSEATYYTRKKKFGDLG